MRIAVIGTGYVGLVTATCFAESGNDVVGMDVEQRKIQMLESGKLPIAKIIDGRISAEDVVSKGFDVLTAATNDKLKILVSTHLEAPS